MSTAVYKAEILKKEEANIDDKSEYEMCELNTYPLEMSNGKYESEKNPTEFEEMYDLKPCPLEVSCVNYGTEENTEMENEQTKLEEMCDLKTDLLEMTNGRYESEDNIQMEEDPENKIYLLKSDPLELIKANNEIEEITKIEGKQTYFEEINDLKTDSLEMSSGNYETEKIIQNGDPTEPAEIEPFEMVQIKMEAEESESNTKTEEFIQNCHEQKLFVCDGIDSNEVCLNDLSKTQEDIPSTSKGVEIITMKISPAGRNKTYYIKDQYIYVRNKVNKSNIYLRCHDYGAGGCLATGCIQKGLFHLRSAHNHKADVPHVESCRMRHQCLERAANDRTDLKEIFDEEKRRYPKSTVNFDSMRKSMARRRKFSRLPLLGNFENLDEALLGNFENLDEALLTKKRKRRSRRIKKPRYDQMKIVTEIEEVQMKTEDAEYFEMKMEPSELMGLKIEEDAPTENELKDEKTVDCLLPFDCPEISESQESAEEYCHEQLDKPDVNKGVEVIIMKNSPAGRARSYYISDEYVYVKNKIKKDITYLRCYDYGEGCNATGFLQEGVFRLRSAHNHEADMSYVETFRMRHNCLERAANDPCGLKQIFDEEKRRHPQSTLIYQSLRKSMGRCRKSSRMPNLLNLGDLDDILI